MNVVNRWVLSAGLGLLIFSGCKKENTDWSYGTDNSTAEAAFSDIYGQIHETSESDNNLRNGCATVTLSDTLGNFPNTVTIDYGTTGCLGTDGRTRKGQIVAVFSGRWRTSGTTITITLVNYEVNGYKAEGTQTITNNGINGSGHMQFTVVVNNGQVTTPSGEVSHWARTTVHEWVEGQTTDFSTSGLAGVLDDVWHITGNGNGITHAGNAYTAVISSPIIYKLNCRWYTGGQIDITPTQGTIVHSINFGDGTTCDADATVTIGTYTTTIHMIQ